LAEDHTIVREGLKKLLETESDIEVVGEASTGRQAVAMTKKLRPAVVVMDIAMPLLNGLEATRQICKEIPGARVLVLSAHSDDAYIEKATAVGARGYLVKQTSSQFLASAIRGISAGESFFSPAVVKRLLHRDQNAPAGKRPVDGKIANLSAREFEVLQLIAEGHANKQVASEFGISDKTVEKHRGNLMKKLAIHDTAGLTRYAIEAGIIESSVQPTVK
jgi:DNA-binding NarL/FixJ family response regulator